MEKEVFRERNNCLSEHAKLTIFLLPRTNLISQDPFPPANWNLSCHTCKFSLAAVFVSGWLSKWFGMGCGWALRLLSFRPALDCCSWRLPQPFPLQMRESDATSLQI